MSYLLDTSAFSDLIREHPKMHTRLENLAPRERIVLRTIVRGEIAYGIGRLPEGKRRETLQAKTTHLLTAFSCESIPPHAAEQYARIKIERQRKGLTLDENDLWIAASAIALGHILVSRDRDFQQIDGLIVEDWTA